MGAPGATGEGDSETLIAERVGAGDQQAIATLCAEWCDSVYAYCSRAVGRGHVDEAVEGAFLRALALFANRPVPDDHLHSALLRCCRVACADLIRAETPAVDSPEGFDCALTAPLLVGSPDVPANVEVQRQLREHLPGCERCQGVRARLEEAELAFERAPSEVTRSQLRTRVQQAMGGDPEADEEATGSVEPRPAPRPPEALAAPPDAGTPPESVDAPTVSPVWRPEVHPAAAKAAGEDPVAAGWLPPAWKPEDPGPASSAPAEAPEKTAERGGDPTASGVAYSTQDDVEPDRDEAGRGLVREEEASSPWALTPATEKSPAEAQEASSPWALTPASEKSPAEAQGASSPWALTPATEKSPAEAQEEVPEPQEGEPEPREGMAAPQDGAVGEGPAAGYPGESAPPATEKSPAEAQEEVPEPQEGEPEPREGMAAPQDGAVGEEPATGYPDESAPPARSVAAAPGRRFPLRRGLLFALGVLLIAAAVAVVFVIIDGESGPPKPETTTRPRPAPTPRATQPEPAPARRDPSPAAVRPTPQAISLRGAVARDYDPAGTDGENPDQARAAIDGKVRSTWSTEEYFPGELGKRGVGLYVALRSARRAGALELVTPNAGGDIEVYGAREGPPQEITDPGWIRLGTRKPVAKRSRISLGDRGRFRYYLVWVRALPETLARMEIAEVRLFAPAPR